MSSFHSFSCSLYPLICSVLKSPTIIVLSTYPFMSANICSLYICRCPYVECNRYLQFYVVTIVGLIHLSLHNALVCLLSVFVLNLPQAVSCSRKTCRAACHVSGWWMDSYYCAELKLTICPLLWKLQGFNRLKSSKTVTSEFASAIV